MNAAVKYLTEQASPHTTKTQNLSLYSPQRELHNLRNETVGTPSNKQNLQFKMEDGIEDQLWRGFLFFAELKTSTLTTTLIIPIFFG